MPFDHFMQWILSFFLICSSIGMICSKKPIHSSLFFLFNLLLFALLYLELMASFIAVMQILVYAGAILVIFMFVIILFQDAYKQIALFPPQSNKLLLYSASGLFLALFFLIGFNISNLGTSNTTLQQGYGTVESLGQALYLDFFFPFEAVTLLFLVAGIGAFYIGKKER